ncbi:SEC-C domain-containing protein [Priestia megaterium]|uniref:SEC-C domain-containing protein n=1 Tax=Priestia megaterium TaxID=1404 RepID=UPI00077D72A5|nr:SEC-C domain-containing protein [Priestia megaterium]
MNKSDIIDYLKNKIPDYSCEEKLNKHVFQFSIHAYPLAKKGELHPFIENLVNALCEIEQAVPGYAKKTINWISTIKKAQFEQVIQILGEIIVLRKLVSIATPGSITLEPTAAPNEKNPEFRVKVDDKFLAIEVKTASLFEFSIQRQTGLQITAQFNKLDYELLRKTGKIVNSRSLKVKDYLVSAEEKFQQYKQKEEFKDDLRLLFIIWDDYINEPLSALANPNCGLLTDNSFYQDSRFGNVDGVILIRHIHQFFRNLQYGELVHYGLEGVQDSFDYVNPAITPVYIKNPLGRKIPNKIVEKLSALRMFNHELPAKEIQYTTEIPVAEYQYTDFIDWQRGISVSGIYTLPEELKNKIISYFVEMPSSEIPISYRDISLFDNMSIGREYSHLLEECSPEEIEERLFESIDNLIRIRQSLSKKWVDDVDKETKRRSDLDTKFKSIFLRISSLGLNEECPCGSEKLFSDCCQDKIRLFNYTHYYDL